MMPQQVDVALRQIHHVTKIPQNFTQFLETLARVLAEAIVVSRIQECKSRFNRYLFLKARYKTRLGDRPGSAVVDIKTRDLINDQGGILDRSREYTNLIQTVRGMKDAAARDQTITGLQAIHSAE